MVCEEILMREYDTGATRDDCSRKPDYEGFLSPLVVYRFGAYMHKNRKQADGKLRDSDNWQKGIPLKDYMKSGWRHFFDWWFYHRHSGPGSRAFLEEALCALLFNAMGYLHVLLTDATKETSPGYGTGASAPLQSKVPRNKWGLRDRVWSSDPMKP
jgi:hypothetical protein